MKTTQHSETVYLYAWNKLCSKNIHDLSALITNFNFLDLFCILNEGFSRRGIPLWWNNTRCASRDSTNQNTSIVDWFSRLERAIFRGICGEIFALFHVCVLNFDTLPPWKVVGTLYFDSSCVSFKYFAFLSVWDNFELLGYVQAAMMIWVLFSTFFLDSLLVTVSGFIGLFRSACYFNLSSL